MLTYLTQFLAQERPIDGDVSLTWPALWGGIAAVCTVATFALGGLIWLIKTTVRQETKKMGDTAEQTLSEVRTQNGNTVGLLAEKSASCLDELVKSTSGNRILIMDISRRMDELTGRLAEHIAKGHTE